VARYFKFRTLDSLRTEIQRRQLDLRLSDDLSPLFRSVAVGPLRAGNSFCIQPMEGCDGTLEGQPGELTLRRFRRFGAGGAKLIWGEATAVVEEGRANPRQLLLNDTNASAIEHLLAECRRAHRETMGQDSDLVVGLQLTHSGRYSYRRPLPVCRDLLLDARRGGDAPLLSDDDLHRLVDRYATAAKLAWKCGFQFVDVKQCHGYLLNELLAAKTRSGNYGGSLENRTRLAREIIQAIRAVAPELIVASRFNAYDGIPYRRRADGLGEPCPWQLPICAWGTAPDDPFLPDLIEPKWWLCEMARLGVAVVNVSLGNPYTTMHVLRPFEQPPPDAYETPEHPLVGVARHMRISAELQLSAPNLPVVGSGYSWLQEFWPHAGAAQIADKKVTFVGVGRAALSQPDFVRQLQDQGRLDRLRVCRTFSYCTALMRSKQNDLGQFPTGCPPFDREVYGPIWDEAHQA
jgi:2,4-dienoyl-CoA reductase-like NADH-dependent reductase (Old Yellow Enzyme family)